MHRYAFAVCQSVGGNNMEYLIGLLSGVAFLFVFFSGLFVGLRLNKKQKALVVDEKEKREMNKFNEDFQKVFSYDVAKAIERKKV